MNEIDRKIETISSQLNSLKEERAKLSKELQSMGGVAESIIQASKQKARLAHNGRLVKMQEVVTDCIAEALEKVKVCLDEQPDKVINESLRDVELFRLEKLLTKQLSKKFVRAYKSNHPIIYKTDSQAFAAYSSTVNIMRIGVDGKLTLFNKIFDNLIPLILKNRKVASTITIIFSLTLLILARVYADYLLIPFVLIAMINIVSGLKLGKANRIFYSIRYHFTFDYDKRMYDQNSNEAYQRVKTQLAAYEAKCIDDIKAIPFEWDSSRDEVIIKSVENKKKAHIDKIADIDSELEDLAAAYQKAIQQRNELAAEMAKAAETAYSRFVTDIEYRMEWKEDILFNICDDNTLSFVESKKCNTLYYSRNVETLQQFAKLYTLQNLTKMHPDFCSQVFLDYRYLCDGVETYDALPARILNTLTRKEEIDAELVRISDEISARVFSVLKSYPDIESFNAKMDEYDCAGKEYVIVHIFGLTGMSETLKMLMRNSVKVGYYIKIYTCHEELSTFYKDIPFNNIEELVEIDEDYTVISRDYLQGVCDVDPK